MSGSADLHPDIQDEINENSAYSAPDLDTSIVSSNRTSDKRRSVKWYHNLGDFFNCFKSFIGTNYQALPFAFHNSGLAFGVIGIFFIGVLNDHCIQLLVKCKNLIIDQVCQDQISAGQLDIREIPRLRNRLQQTMGYGDIGKKAIGPWCFHLIQIAVWFTQFMGLISYFIFIGNTLYEIFTSWPVPYVIQNGTNSTNMSMFEDDSPHFGLGVPMLNMFHLGDVRHRRSTNQDNYDIVDNWTFSTDFYDNITTEAAVTSNYSTMSVVTDITMTSNSSHTNITTTTSSPWAPTFKPAFYKRTIAPDLRLLILIPLPFFLGTSLIRKLRHLAPFSSIATVALAGGAFSVLGFIIDNFRVSDFEWIKYSTLPLFVGQLISAFEGIGCVIPIQSSMDGNRHLFPWFVHGAVTIVCLILCSFGVLGYLTYGSHVAQIVVENIPQDNVLSKVVDVTLIISVLFTYPLQCFPVIDIMETYLFSKGRFCSSCRRSQPVMEVLDDSGQWEYQGLGHDLESSIEASADQVSSITPKSVPAWKRNVVRIGITLCCVALAILLKDAYAYTGAFTGAVGASLLALILPCTIHLCLRWGELSVAVVAKDIAIVIFAVVSSVMTIVSLGMKVVKTFWK